MSSGSRPSFDQEVQQLYDDFIKRERPAETAAEVAVELIDLILERERIRRRIDPGLPNTEEIDSQTLTSMGDWDTDDPNLLLAEKVFHRLASGQGAEAVNLLKASIDSRAKAISDDQRRKAQTPKRANPVNALIEQIVFSNPAISEKELLRALHDQIGKGVIADIDDEYITPADGKAEEIKVGGLKDRLTRTKKKIAKAG
jgi:hypothetical protein